MRKIREVLRLYFAAALSIRAIARSLGTSPSTVGEYLRRAKVAGLTWPVPETIDDAGLERRLFPVPPSSRASWPLPEWSDVHRELRRKDVTLALLWQEYKALHPEGLQYRFWAAPVRFPAAGESPRVPWAVVVSPRGIDYSESFPVHGESFSAVGTAPPSLRSLLCGG